jgi:hypothetical protein
MCINSIFSFTKPNFLIQLEFAKSFVTLFSHVPLTLYKTLPKFVNAVIFLQTIIIFHALSSFMRKNSLYRYRARHLCVSLNFNNMWATFSTSLSKGYVYFPPAPFYSWVGGLGIWNFTNVVLYGIHDM